MNPTDDELAQITAGSTSLADIRRRVYEAGYKAGENEGKYASLYDEARQGSMTIGTEYGLKLGGSSELAGLILDMDYDEEDQFIEHPEEALPHTVMFRRVWSQPWQKHVYYPPVPMA